MVFFKVVLEFFHSAVTMSAFCDVRAARGVAPRFEVGRIQHLDMRVLWVQEMKASGILEMQTLGTDSNKADLGTKPFQGPRLCKLR